MTPAIACVAALLHLTAPPHPPPVLVLPATAIEQIRADRPRPAAVYVAGLIVLPPRASFALRAHELAHAVQDYNHRPTATPAAEAEADFAARHAAAWCQGD